MLIQLQLSRRALCRRWCPCWGLSSSRGATRRGRSWPSRAPPRPPCSSSRAGSARCCTAWTLTGTRTYWATCASPVHAPMQLQPGCMFASCMVVTLSAAAHALRCCNAPTWQVWHVLSGPLVRCMPCLSHAPRRPPMPAEHRQRPGGGGGDAEAQLQAPQGPPHAVHHAGRHQARSPARQPSKVRLLTAAAWLSFCTEHERYAVPMPDTERDQSIAWPSKPVSAHAHGSSPTRRRSDSDSLLVAWRGPSQFVGELSAVAAPNMPVDTWRTSVRAATDVAALLLTKTCLKMLVTRVPEAEVALRACAPPPVSGT